MIEMDKNYIKENNLDEAISRFQELADYKYPKQSLKKLYEYTFITAPQVNEEGEDDGELQQPQANGMNQQPQNGAPDASMQGGDMNGQMGGQMAPEGTGMPQDGNMNQGGGDMMQGDGGMPPAGGDMAAPMGDDMQGDMGGDDMQAPPMEDDGIETTEMEPDDEVIDVDDLTQSQEATEYKIDGVDDRLSKIYAVVQKFSDQLDKQEQSIMNLKDEFEKRNPTQTEKFNLRSQASGPFNQTPTEYWDKLSQENPNYEIIRDNEVSPSDEQEKYEIRKGDISGLNMKNISDTLNIDQNLKNYIGF
jgi:hypothetical protein